METVLHELGHLGLVGESEQSVHSDFDVDSLDVVGGAQESYP